MNHPGKPLPGSGRTETTYPKVEPGSQSNPQVINLEFSFILKHKTPPDASAIMSRKEMIASFGPSEDAIELIKKFVDDHGLKLLSIDRTQRKVTCSGTTEEIARAFNTKMHQYAHPEGNYHSHEGELHIPEALHKDVLGVIGLHQKPVVKPRSKNVNAAKKLAQAPLEAKQSPVVFSNNPTILAKLYDFPDKLDGSQQKIALLQLGGGYIMKDIETYFTSLHLDTPVLKDISVGGGTNMPQQNDMKTIEVYSDIYMAGAVANKAELLIYFASNNHLHALVGTFQAAVYDETNEPGIISCSWGSAEKEWNPNDIDVMESVLEDATRLKITSFVASGDAGSGDGAIGINVDYPSSSPWVTGVGGTVAYVDASYSRIIEEVVWNKQAGTLGATGGGVSAKLPLPNWQKCANVPKLTTTPPFLGRGVPDLAAVAGFYSIYMFGAPSITGGTSCDAPFLAALMAMANQKAGKNLGFINEVLYRCKLEEGIALCQDITKGDNGLYKAGKGWNACTGLGRPFGKKFVEVLVRELSGNKQHA